MGEEHLVVVPLSKALNPRNKDKLFNLHSHRFLVVASREA